MFSRFKLWEDISAFSVNTWRQISSIKWRGLVMHSSLASHRHQLFSLIQLAVSLTKPQVFLRHHQLQLCRLVWSQPTGNDTTMASVIPLTVTLRASQLPIPLLSSLNHWNQQESCSNWLKLHRKAGTFVPVMQRLKECLWFSCWKDNIHFQTDNTIQFSIFWPYRFHWGSKFRWNFKIIFVGLIMQHMRGVC